MNSIKVLPIDAVLTDLRSAFQHHPNVVLSADPGAGKTTRVPLALLHDDWLAGKKIIMLEPRRLAAQRGAAYIAAQIGEKAGETIGYRIRGESKVGKRTRIEVVTEGILTRLFQSDPSLPDVGLVIFDEFHERSVHADLGLAFALNVQEHLRSDLRILIMSATLDGLALSSLLGDAPIITSKGRAFPVETRYLQHVHDGFIEPLVTSTILRALREDRGDVLAFLPGQREIHRVESLLAKEDVPRNIMVHALFGDASSEKQHAALAPAHSGHRKVILSTSVAETSLTIDGVGVVVDCGLARSARFDPRRGMSGLVTVPVSQSSADQRRGRAGRQEPGVCYRLWTEQQHGQLPKFALPEILTTDLAPLTLELARWGTPHGEDLLFLDPPPDAHFSQSLRLLVQLGALDAHEKLTKHGRAMSDIPVHPRLAHMLLRGKERGLGALACDVAALIEERDLLRGEKDRDIDLHSRWYALRKGRAPDANARERARSQAARLRGLLRVNDDSLAEDRLGFLLALVYPERTAQQQDIKHERYQLAGGAVATLPKGSMLSRHKYLAVGDVDGIGSEVKLFLAEPMSEEDIRETFADQIVKEDEVRWDDREEMVIARRIERFGAIVLSEVAAPPSSDDVRDMMIEGIRTMGIDALPWSKNAVALRTRSEWLRLQALVGGDWPDLSEQRLMNTLQDWLGPHLYGISRRSHLTRLDLSTILQSIFSYQQLRSLDRLAPTHLTVPTGSRILIDYSTDSPPILAVRLQEMFGETVTPTVGGGNVKVLLHLLSPAHRPLAVTQDLPSFWRNAYPDVRKDMRGRYPKHHWPENPQEAKPTKRKKTK